MEFSKKILYLYYMTTIFNSQSYSLIDNDDDQIPAPLRTIMIEDDLRVVPEKMTITDNENIDNTRCFNLKICLILSCAFLPITLYPLLCLL